MLQALLRYYNPVMSVFEKTRRLWVNSFNLFEFYDIPNGTWHVENPDGDNIKWEQQRYNHYKGSYSVKPDNFNNEADFTDALITDKIYVGNAASMNFNFRYAIASRPGFAGDKMVVSVSQDCGTTWQSVRHLHRSPVVRSH